MHLCILTSVLAYFREGLREEERMEVFSDPRQPEMEKWKQKWTNLKQK
jgi:hypothetical protein